jgi:hypothetical protein
VVAALGAGRDPVGGHQRGVQADERQAGGAGSGQHVVQVGCVAGDDVECFVQVAVGGGDAQAGLAGQGAQVPAVPQPAQHKQDLGVHCADPLCRASTETTAMAGDPAGHRLQHRGGYVQAGTMGHSGLPEK